jgi:hypothetical protein
MSKNFIRGERVIVDSGFGYDLGRFVKNVSGQVSKSTVSMETGMFRGINMDFDDSMIESETKEKLIEKMEKYKNNHEVQRAEA